MKATELIEERLKRAAENRIREQKYKFERAILKAVEEFLGLSGLSFEGRVDDPLHPLNVIRGVLGDCALMDRDAYDALVRVFVERGVDQMLAGSPVTME